MYGKYSVGIRSTVVEHYATGQQKTVIEGLEAQFENKGLTDQEVEIGLKTFNWPGLPEDRETGTLVSPISHLSVFDSESARKQYGWSDEDENLVVQTLRSNSGLGREFIEVEVPKAPAPWAGYDKLESADKIAEIALATETKLADVIAYELENRDREDVIDVLRDLLDSDDSEAESKVVIEA